MKFGIFDQNDRGLLPLPEHYEARLKLLEFYDRAGFDTYHCSEHHATPLSATPATGAWLGAVAQRTKRLRFGPLVYILPMRHPLQVAEEICLLDQMSGGRFELGVGRGISPYELGYHGVDPSQSPAMYREALTLLLAALTQDSVTFEGEFWRCHDVPIELRPAQRPHPPLWAGCGTTEAATHYARTGVNVVCNAPVEPVRRIMAAYRAEAAKHAHAPATLGMSRAIVLAEDGAEARAAARRGWVRHAQSFLKLWRKHGTEPLLVRMTEDFADASEAGTAFAGTPAELRDALLRQVVETGVNYVVGRFAFGDLTHEEQLRSATLFAEHVMPALAEQHRKAA